MAKLLPAREVIGLSLHKQGNLPEDYEDAFFIGPGQTSFAVADGATESAFAASWANLLTSAFTQEGAVSRRRLPGLLQSLRQRWLEEVAGQPLSWYAESKVQTGAYAALLALWLEERSTCFFWNTSKRWRAFAVGDCCLFQERNERIITRFPAQHSSEFSDSPYLLGSRAQTPRPASQKRICRDLLDGDRFWLMTDALAAWFLRQEEAGKQPWRRLHDVVAAAESKDAFQSLIGALRESGELRNDDVTLIAVQV